ncbi:MAG: DUF2189 domain-containing protein [Betaproteobacteria bacterium]|nr:DUF2189 domain-containing protein [Betaproteobacteria bacterium]
MEKAISGSFHPPRALDVARVSPLRAGRWLRAGWADLRANPGPSLSHGFLFVATGWTIFLMFGTHIDLVVTAVSGFLLVGPVAAAAFYELSREREAGVTVSFDGSLAGASRRAGALLRLGLVLALLGVIWAWTSAELFRHEFGAILPSIGDDAWRNVLDWRYSGFVTTYLGTGAVLAVIAFVVAAVSAPLLFDRRTDTTTAILTSLRVIGTNPVAMLIWALSIAVLVTVGFLTAMLGLIVILPWLGHATWHAYRDLVRR